MTEPVIANRSPAIIELEADKDYFWCACGLSKNQPFCDGSHSVTDITPVKFNSGDGGKSFLCVCKHSAKKPFCDGTHKKLPA